MRAFVCAQMKNDNGGIYTIGFSVNAKTAKGCDDKACNIVDYFGDNRRFVIRYYMDGFKSDYFPPIRQSGNTRPTGQPCMLNNAKYSQFEDGSKDTDLLFSRFLIG